MNNGRWKLIFLGLVLLNLCGVPVPAEPDPENTPDLSAEDLVELRSALAEMGITPSAQDETHWAESLGHQQGRLNNRFLIPGQGSLVWRARKVEDTSPWIWDSRLKADFSGWRLRLRHYGNGDHQGFQSGNLDYKDDRFQVCLGNLGHQVGHGLLVGSPGRNSSLATGQKPRKTRWKMGRWMAPPEDRSLVGGGLHWKHETMELGLVVGNTALKATAGGEKVVAASVVKKYGRSLTGVTGLKSPFGWGMSFWGNGVNADGEWSAEVAWWKPHSLSQATTAWQVFGLWNFPRGLRLVTGMAVAQDGPHSPLAQRPTLLKADQGRGWTLGLIWNPVPRSRLGLQVSGASHEKYGSVFSRENRLACDLVASRSWPGGWAANTRIYLASQGRRIWSARFPWQPARNSDHQMKSLAQATLSRKSGAGYLRIQLKVFHHSDFLEFRLRSLISTVGHLSLGNNFHMRAGLGSSWGDDLDLVGAVSPMPGMVMPRHWGKWKTEVFGGLGMPILGGEVWCGASQRRSDPAISPARSLQLWARAQLNW